MAANDSESDDRPEASAEPEPRRRWRSYLGVSAVWLAAILVGAAIWAVKVPGAHWFTYEPVVGSGHSLPSVAPAPDPVLQPLTPSPVSDATRVAKAVAAIKIPAGVKTSVVVLDASTGDPVAKINPKPQVPASTMKVLTSAVALEVLGADKRFETSVVTAKPGRIVLVGGGDPLLATASKDAAGGASLEELADATAKVLKADGVTAVALDYDDSLFKGPSWHTQWSESFRWSVAPVTALKADQARLHAPTPGNHAIARDPNPSLRAANSFKSLLSKRGIEVGKVAHAKATGAAPVIAQVSSLTVGEIVEHLLRVSDNDATEALARHVALADSRAASFEGSAEAVAANLKRMDLWANDMAIKDTSGISSNNRVSPEVLAKAVRLGLTDERFRSLTTGLPVAAVSGTLTNRFAATPALPGRGLVRAKTGTIRGAYTLAGYAVSSDGHAFTFGIMASGGTQQAAQGWLDAVSSVLAD